MSRAVRWLLATLVALIALGVWTIVGLLYWVPLLARAVAAFTSGMMIAAIANQPAARPGQALDDAFMFYINGFSRIWEPIEKLYTVHIPQPEPSKNDDPFAWKNVKEFLRRMAVVLWQTVLAVLFWAAIILLLSRTSLVKL